MKLISTVMKKIICILTIFAAALLINVASEASVIKTDRIYIFCPFCGRPYGVGDCKSEKDSLGFYHYTMTCQGCGSTKTINEEELARIVSRIKQVSEKRNK